MVYVAHDGMTALHTLRTQKPQIMLLDLMMPGMDGFEVCRRIRQFSDIPIISCQPRTMKQTAWSASTWAATIM